MTKLIALVGTNSDQSTNRQLLHYMSRHFSDKADIEVVEIKDIPFFNKGIMGNLPEIVVSIEAKIAEADGLIISTPEYDHAIPAALMNALEWFSVGSHPLVDKPVMITGASYGTLGSSRAQAQLRQILDAPELRAYIMPSSEYHLSHSLQAFDEAGDLKDAEKIAELDALFEDFLRFVAITSQLTATHAQHKQAVSDFSWDKV
ncbi:NADPH-dependent FMN reductase [Streptococcus loxodontisalivarius]|uniref:NAD(P)H-dependent FMN reductase n=1 Tax=Streptococcus loxodontisalivarius TaxID=1349415 RepID=A0ABS2PRH0_9STRE|nr:NADPH-dependent FMN reductase [Streptococcus loxodontisalivarius]MBM7642533.1 NAD(P)H-dependent FMN reductase [Streptococcus loxodontisalivarius]